MGYPASAEAIEAHARIHHSEFLATFDRNKQRTFNTRGRLPDKELAKTVFGEAGPSLEAIVERIRDGRSKNVVVLLGAGVRYVCFCSI